MQLVGAWNLVSWNRRVGETEEPGMFGVNPLGFLTYTSDGHFCVAAMSRERASMAGNDVRGGTVPEKAAAYDSFLGYGGEYEVNQAGGFVVHRVLVSSYPNWTGSAQKRFVSVTGHFLRLTTPPVLVKGREVVGIVVWQRAVI